RDDINDGSDALVETIAGDLEHRPTLIDVRCDPEMIDVNHGSWFYEYSLPDAAGRRVPAPLFADGLLVVVHRILDAENNQLPRTGGARRGERIREIELERNIAAFATPAVHAVAPAVGGKVRGSDGEDYAPITPVMRVRD